MTDKDAELLDKIRQKDHQCFQALYKANYKKLYVLAYQYTHEQEIAEEIVNDVFLKLWTNATQLNITQSLGGYLSRSVINAALNNNEKEKSKVTKQEKYLSANFTEVEQADDDAQILEETLLKLEKAINELSPQCRKVLMMSKFEKQKQQEIADKLNISVKTVKSHLTYAYQKIRTLMFKEQILLIALFFLSSFH